MSRKFRALAGALALAMSTMAAGPSAGQPETFGPGGAGSDGDPREHTIIILSSSYFPFTTYVAAGDTVRFVNETTLEQVVTSYAAGWTTGIIEPGGEVVVTVTGAMEGSYFGDRERAMEGRLSFAPSPMER